MKSHSKQWGNYHSCTLAPACENLHSSPTPSSSLKENPAESLNKELVPQI